MKYIVMRNVEPEFIKFLGKNFSLKANFDKKGNKVGYDLQPDELNEFIDSLKQKKENKISEKSFSQAKRYNIMQKTCKERLILNYFYEKERISSLNSLSKNIFSDPEYNTYFKSNNKSQLTLALSNLIESGFILKVERGLYKITLEGTKIMKLINEDRF
jgi:hypothetical protein